MNIELNWKAYFKEFTQIHGGDPVTYAGRLLFRDGWTYSATDYVGPEWPPPAEPKLGYLKWQYWNIRRQAVKQELEERKNIYESLIEMQKTKSATLQQVIITYDDKGKPKRESGSLDLTNLKARIDILEMAWIECLTELEKLTPPAPTDQIA